MDDAHVLPHPIEQALARGWTVLTANQRAARTLRHGFERRQQALGRASWQPPSVLAWDAWLGSLWHRILLEGHGSELLLNRTQEHMLWRAVISADAATVSLRPLDALARTSAQAWGLLHSYRGRRRMAGFPGNTDSRTFERWAVEFQRRCGRAGYVTEAQLPEVLAAAVADGRLGAAAAGGLPRGVLLAGFDRITLAEKALWAALRAAGAPVEELKSTKPPVDVSLVTAADESAELAECARWCRERLAMHPQDTIAVIHPAIANARTEIDRTFRRIIAPELNDAAAATGSAPWEFSLGVSLARTPLVAAALDLLHWAVGPLPLDRVTGLLLSPYFAPMEESEPAERLARAEFDAFFLRDQHLLRPEFSLREFAGLVSRWKRAGELRELAKWLAGMRSQWNRLPLTGERSHAEWASVMQDVLIAAGWLACASRDDSVEFQTRRRWESALDELATLDFTGHRVSFAEALTSLERVAAETIFAPESRGAPIQILGPLEAAGSEYDAVWFLGAGDRMWPATLKPNPLLPWGLQRELEMPGADPDVDAAYARRVTERIAACAPETVFSFAAMTAEAVQRRSPMLNALPWRARPIRPSAQEDGAAETVRLIDLPDAVPPPPSAEHIFQGGAAVLQAQAACGFKAFAERRLFSSAVDSIALGLDPMERGNVVHDVLERFWAEVQTQAALKQMSNEEREAVLARAVDDALSRHRPGGGDPAWPRAYIDTERERLRLLLGPWLEFEMTRKPFAVKLREEKLTGVQIGPLRLDVRVDRVDELVNEDGEPGGEVILDYKTGSAAPASWLGPRPDQPQLPLYAVVSEPERLAAVGFALVRRGEGMEITGYEEIEGALFNAKNFKKESLEAQVDEWRGVLTSLASDFRAGLATVAPKRYPQTCAYCEQRLLCRLQPATLEPEALEDQDTPESDPDSPVNDFADGEAAFG